MNRNGVRNGLIAAAVMNISGVLIFSRAFTNRALNDADPVVLSNLGLVIIAVRGLAYLGAASTPREYDRHLYKIRSLVECLINQQPKLRR